MQMPDFTTYQWLSLAIPVAIAAPSCLWQWYKRSDENDLANMPRFFRINQEPSFHTTSGTPSLQQFTQGIELNYKAKRLAETLYNLGLQQYNHPVNNRDGLVKKTRQIMVELATNLSFEQLKLAADFDAATDSTESGPEKVRQKDLTRILNPNTRTYAMYKRREHEAHASIDRDLERGVPRTDYTCVKKRISLGETDLNFIMSELPIFWRSIRSLNEKFERPEVTRRPPRPETFNVEFIMADGRILRDKRAEKDGDWLVSDKHGFLVPCPPPTEIWTFKENGKAGPTGKSVLIVDQEPSSEWETEFWRRDGYMDQTYLRARAGTLPHQLRQAYRRRQIRHLQWYLIGAVIIANIVIFAINNA